MTPYIQIITTVESRAKAEQMAALITGRRLAACVQVGGPIQSTYWWKDKLETAEEWQLVCKTKRDFYPAVEALIKENHTYQVPEVLAIPLLDGNPAYFDWINAEVTPG